MINDVEYLKITQETILSSLIIIVLFIYIIIILLKLIDSK